MARCVVVLAFAGCARFGYESLGTPLLGDTAQSETPEQRLNRDGLDPAGSDPAGPDAASTDASSGGEPVLPYLPGPDAATTPPPDEPCGAACDAGVPPCSGAGCTPPECAAGRAECDGDLSVSCEADLSSVQHCGSCNNTCAPSNATPVCNGGRCEVQSCAPGFEDCDGAPDNGCEAALGSVEHCSACYDACTGNGGAPVCNAGVCDTACELTGTFALKLTASGSWPENTAIYAGSGTFETWLRVGSVQSGNTLTVSVTECGRTVPPEQNQLVPETMLTLFPNAVFDAGFLPSSNATVTLGSNNPGASLSWPLTVTQMGINLANPASFSWPSDAADLPAASLVDMDGDGKPGVTIAYADGGGFVYPRTSSSPFSTTRADQAYVAARLGFSLSGTLTSCSSASGTAQLPLYDRGILGCNREGSTLDCTSSERSIVDTYKPAWTMGAASFVMVAVAASADCAAIRAAVP